MTIATIATLDELLSSAMTCPPCAARALRVQCMGHAAAWGLEILWIHAEARAVARSEALSYKPLPELLTGVRRRE
jgi:hypothetical protein